MPTVQLGCPSPGCTSHGCKAGRGSRAIAADHVEELMRRECISSSKQSSAISVPCQSKTVVANCSCENLILPPRSQRRSCVPTYGVPPAAVRRRRHPDPRPSAQTLDPITGRLVFLLILSVPTSRH